ncbi:helix-turn-helix domain-containing protein [Rubrivivax gelatinosus]|uniref:Crp/Fnr family transcriptional regulator n=1 Tax=Rubrivivax gelatinosus TaxID=28068 RepID=A0ABS1DVB7_RUBGE|nr:Crp/Fnr family transcriptional regulator [Rubrivivax gelatinosus]
MPAANHLIERLPPHERGRLLALCEPVQLALGEVLCEAGATTGHVYFPTGGFISLVAPVDPHVGLEVGMVGREGMLGTPLLLGLAASPVRALVQGAGSSWRVEATAFLRELAASEGLRAPLLRYVYVLMAQMVSAAGCLHYHPIGQRLARWLLMSQDRADGDRLHVTHEFLAYMLGVRRVGITLAAGELQRRGLIRYHRGELSVLDRGGLEAAACGCYRSDRLAYRLNLE